MKTRSYISNPCVYVLSSRFLSIYIYFSLCVCVCVRAGDSMNVSRCHAKIMYNFEQSTSMEREIRSHREKHTQHTLTIFIAPFSTHKFTCPLIERTSFVIRCVHVYF